MAQGPGTPKIPLKASHLSLSCTSCGDEVVEVKFLPYLHSLPLCDKAACLKRTLLKGVTCPQCQEAFTVPAGGFARIPSPGVQAVSKQCEEKEVFCHEDHNEPQKAVSCFPQCPGATGDLLEHGIPEEQICLKKSVVQRIAAITASPFLASGPLCSIHFDPSAINTSLSRWML